MTQTALLDLPGLRARESAEPGFAAALAGVAESLGLDPSFIAAVMVFESRIDPQAVNPSSGATGLIQFMPSTAKMLGTTIGELRTMSAIQQLEYVREYFARVGRAIRPDVPGDYYMAVFMPAYVGKPADFVLSTKGSPIYDQNAGLDGDKDGVLVVGDVTAKVENLVAGARTRPLAVFESEKKTRPSQAPAVQLPRLPPLPSSASSFGQLSAPVPVGASMRRELIVFAASCELSDMQLLIEKGDQLGIQRRISVYWADVLRQSESAPHPKEWCGAFALWCVHQSKMGLDLHWRFETPTDKRSGFLYALDKTRAPKPGDIAYLDQPFQHHAIVTSVEGDTVHTIDGNQGASTPIKTHSAPLKHWSAFYSIEGLLEKIA